VKRRTLLRTVGAAFSVAAAGCSSGGGGSDLAGRSTPSTAELWLEETSDAALTDEVFYTVAADSDDADSTLLAEAIDGHATRTTTDPPPLGGRERLVYGDQLCRVSRETVDRTPAVRYDVRLDVPQETPDPGTVVRFADLPAVDRETFAEHGFAKHGPIGVGTTMVYRRGARTASALVPDSEYDYIRWDDGTLVRWAVDDATERTLYTYRYSAERTATTAEYGQRLSSRFAFELDDLSQTQRDIVVTAIGEGSYVVDTGVTPSAAFVSLVDRIREQERVRRLDGNGGDHGPYAVQFDGDLYVARYSLADSFDSTGV